MGGVTYRTITRPSDWQSWTRPVDWMQWVNNERLFPSVAPRHPASCSMCYGATTYRADGSAWDRCWPCKGYEDAVDSVVPVAYSISDGLESLLHRFKDFGPSYAWMALPLASVAVTFFERHQNCIQSRHGQIQVATVVPSGNASRTENHLETVLRLVQYWPVPWRTDVLTKVSPGRPPRGELVRGFYRADPSLVRGNVVLVFDDTWTSGSSIANCALALKEAGARSVVSVTLGRQLHSGFGTADVLIDEARVRLYDPTRCVICG